MLRPYKLFALASMGFCTLIAHTSQAATISDGAGSNKKGIYETITDPLLVGYYDAIKTEQQSPACVTWRQDLETGEAKVLGTQAYAVLMASPAQAHLHGAQQAFSTQCPSGIFFVASPECKALQEALNVAYDRLAESCAYRAVQQTPEMQAVRTLSKNEPGVCRAGRHTFSWALYLSQRFQNTQPTSDEVPYRALESSFAALLTTSQADALRGDPSYLALGRSIASIREQCTSWGEDVDNCKALYTEARSLADDVTSSPTWQVFVQSEPYTEIKRLLEGWSGQCGNG